MAKVAETLAVVAVLAAMFLLGRLSKRETACAEITTVTDTLWVEIHDTAFLEKAVTFLRHDTVRLAAVHDTTTIHDSVLVTVPISGYEFEGENYRIAAEGYAVRLRDVWINYPTVTTTVTNTVTTRKRWSFGVGVQAGYGATVHGMSPYAGLGVSFGYAF